MWGTRSRSRSKRMPTWLFGFFFLLFGVGGGLLLRMSLHDQHVFEAMMDHGTETMAAITRAEVSYDSKSRPSYTAELAWVDAAGNPQSFPPTHISPAFWHHITRSDGSLGVTKTRMRYLASDPTARPVIMADFAERQFQDKFGVWAGYIGIAAGVISGFFLLRRMARL